jgi:hypothetical protein
MVGFVVTRVAGMARRVVLLRRLCYRISKHNTSPTCDRQPRLSPMRYCANTVTNRGTIMTKS